jgi:hypothetical protein
MKSNNTGRCTGTRGASEALGALEGWMETLHGAGGYYGPVVGMRGMAMTWCGPAHDWRWEGLLDGWVARHRRTAEPVYLERIKQAFRDLQNAQLADGSFRNSSFDLNPCEGGMPHEPAVMAAVLRAARYLREHNQVWPEGTEAMIERFVEERLITSLWNKTLQTFNNWLQSDFDLYSPPAVASIIETLCEYGALTDTAERWTPFITGAAASLLKSQFRTGPLTGALPVSSADRASASPFFAARCLPALTALHLRTGDVRFSEAADALSDFVKRSLCPGIVCMTYAGRPNRIAPLYTGATAGALLALDRTARLEESLLRNQLDWLLPLQTAAGGFDTAVGFGRGLPQRDPPDWRDALPVCGWSSMVYALLASRVDEPVSQPAPASPVCRAVTVRGRRAELTEDADTLAIRCGTKPAYVWRKRTLSPEICLL